MIRPVASLVTTTRAAAASAARSLSRKTSACAVPRPDSRASGWCTSALSDARERKAVSQVEDIHPPTQPPKLLDDAPVIAITSGRRGEITRHGERNTPCLARRLRTLWIQPWL